MPLTPDVVLRTDDAAGDSFLTFLTGSGDRAQAVAVINLNGDPMGVTGTPLVVSVSNSVTINDSTPIDVNIASETHSHTHVTYVTAGAAVASAIIASSASTLVEFRAILDSAVTSDRYVMLFDAAALPVVDGTAPLWRLFVPAGAEASETWTASGLVFPLNGIVAAVSSTINTLTITGAEAYFSAIRF